MVENILDQDFFKLYNGKYFKLLVENIFNFTCYSGKYSIIL